MTRDDILTFDDVKYESVVVPEWGGATIWLRTPHSIDRDAFEASLIVQSKVRKNGKIKTEQTTSLVNIRAKLVVRCVVTGQGSPDLMFRADDADKLAVKNAAAIDRLYDVAQRLAGISETDIEELAGN